MTKIEEIEQKLVERIKDVEKCYDKEIKPFYDEKIKMLNVSALSKEHQNALINTRNCLIVQKSVYEEVLNYIRGYKQ